MPSFGTKSGIPIKITMGKKQYNISDESSAADLGRQFMSAMSEIQKDFMWVVDQIEGYLPNDLEVALSPTLQLSQYYCPVSKDGSQGNEPGYLRDSAYLATESFRGGARVEIGYAKGGDPDYAIFVHEVIDYKHEEPTGAKFLQRAIDEDWFDMQQRLYTQVAGHIGT